MALLEHAVQFFSLTLVQDVETLERVQARPTKMIPAFRNTGFFEETE